MKNNTKSSLYIFIDESGDFNFKENGSKHFLMSALITNNINSARPLNDLKYELIETVGNDPYSLEYFHATEDRQRVRNVVLRSINEMQDIKVKYSFCDKSKLKDSLKNKLSLYSVIFSELIKDILAFEDSNNYSKVTIICDKVLSKKEADIFFKEAKPLLKKNKKEFSFYFHRTLSHMHSQIADYFSWSKFISLERQDFRSLVLIEKFIEKEIDISTAHKK